ncbi:MULTISPECIES: hypothetical protein [Nocardiopsis]|uniref:Uncharacterized protein n=1 Tax=Nocardiopsis sinuspersici TaxID=501010 RepID=A0A1V3C417_9ACTN|nr:MULTISPECIES: hypothetical protein [Nocardiopsis]OOC55392.1 hypothetical protein NOSIN_17520 [Nocardiopsis sinuspersici]
MNPHETPGYGDGHGSSPRPRPPRVPFGRPPSRPGRYGTGLVAVLAVAAVLAGASFLGGGIALGGMVAERVAAAGGPEPSEEPAEAPHASEPPSGPPAPTEDPLASTDEPTREPTGTPTTGPTAEELISSGELVTGLRSGFGIDSRQDITDEVCAPADEEERGVFQCTSAMDTDLVRVAAFESDGVAMLTAMAMRESEDNAAEDVQDACHFVLVWFEHHGLDQGERDDMAEAAREIAGCP